MPEERERQRGYPQVTITDFRGGLAPLWYEHEYARFGNRNMASNMEDADISSPGFITQGPKLKGESLSDHPFRSILDKIAIDGNSYAITDYRLYDLDDNYNISLVDGGYFDGDKGLDIESHQGFIYYSYEDTGDVYVGRYDIENNSVDNTWQGPLGGSYGVLEEGGGSLYISAGNFVSRLVKEVSVDGTITEETFTADALQLPANTEIVDMKWHQNRLWIATNNPDKQGKNNACIYIWDGWSVSFSDEIKISGRLGGMFLNNGVIFCVYEDNVDHNVVGIIDGQAIRPLTKFDGDLPDKNSITNYKSYIVFISGDDVYMFGSAHPQLDSSLSHLASDNFLGATANPYGIPVFSRTQPIQQNGTNYNVLIFEDYSTDGYWRSLAFTTSANHRMFHGWNLQIFHDTLKDTNKACKVKILNADGSEAWSTNIDASTDQGGVSILSPQVDTKETIIELDFSEGDSSEPIKVKAIYLRGKTDR